MNRCLAGLLLAALVPTLGLSQNQNAENGSENFSGPKKDVTYHVILLIESDDQNRRAYDGPASKGLAAAGYDRTVIAGSATAMVTIGQGSCITGTSRYGQFEVSTSMLNTTQENEIQVNIHLQTKNPSPITIDTMARAPLGRWFLVGATDSRVGLAKHAADGKRAVVVMRVDEGVLLLD